MFRDDEESQKTAFVVALEDLNKTFAPLRARWDESPPKPAPTKMPSKGASYTASSTIDTLIVRAVEVFLLLSTVFFIFWAAYGREALTTKRPAKAIVPVAVPMPAVALPLHTLDFAGITLSTPPDKSMSLFWGMRLSDGTWGAFRIDAANCPVTDMRFTANGKVILGWHEELMRKP